MLTESNKEIFEKYYKKSTDYYIGQLESYSQRGRCSFSVSAFFLGLFWMSYRKMYKTVIIISVLIFLESILEGVLLSYNIITADAYELISKLSMIAWGAILSILANRLYIKQSIKEVDEILNKNLEEQELELEISKKGGVNWLAPFVWLAVMLFVEMLPYLVE